MPDTRPDPFELINTPFAEAPLERWRAEAMAGGAMSVLGQVYDVVKNDAAAVAARADAGEARTALIQHLCDKVGEFEQRFNDLEARFAEAEDARRADYQAAREFEEEELALPPDFLDEPPPQKIEDDTHQPSGELHEVAAKEEPELLSEDEEPSELPEPPLETEDAGGVPLSYGNVPTSYVRGGPRDAAASKKKDQAEFALPEPGMTTDARRRKPKGQIIPQPTAISLNKA